MTTDSVPTGCFPLSAGRTDSLPTWTYFWAVARATGGCEGGGGDNVVAPPSSDSRSTVTRACSTCSFLFPTRGSSPATRPLPSFEVPAPRLVGGVGGTIPRATAERRLGFFFVAPTACSSYRAKARSFFASLGSADEEGCFPHCITSVIVWSLSEEVDFSSS